METVAYGATQYRDVLDTLAEVGLDGGLAQTGGICATLGRPVWRLLPALHCQEDAPGWDRAAHERWLVTLYRREERAPVDGPLLRTRTRTGRWRRAVESARQGGRQRGRCLETAWLRAKPGAPAPVLPRPVGPRS